MDIVLSSRNADQLHTLADALDPIYLRHKGTPKGDFVLARIGRLRARAYALEAAAHVRTYPPEGAAPSGSNPNP